MTFAVQFRAHVIPRLHNLVRAEAVCIAHGVETFDNAINVVMHHARELGALHLPAAVLHDLEDWICSTLLTATVEAEAVREAA